MTTKNQDRYKNGYIYKLVNSVDDAQYVGSSCCPTKNRMYRHKQDARRFPNRKVYQHLNTIGWNNVRIIIIERYPCSNKQDLLTREQHFIELLKPQLNKIASIDIDGLRQKESKKFNSKKTLAMRYDCKCGGHTSIHEMSRHSKSKRHQFYEACDGLNIIDPSVLV